MGAANPQPVTGHGQHAAWRAVALGRDASPPISSTLIELRFQHGQSPVDITGGYGVWIGHVAAPFLRRSRRLIVAVVDTGTQYQLPLAPENKLWRPSTSCPKKFAVKSPMITKHEISETEASERLDMGVAQLLAIAKK